MKTIMVTGAAGFIGSAFVREALNKSYKVVIVDALTYAGHIENFEELLRDGVCEFARGDIRDVDFLDRVFSKYQFDGV